MKYALFAILILNTPALADPAPGTPGHSGDHNPQGSPPGQGGTAPGNSGNTNPHGSPPGQRIGSPGGTAGLSGAGAPSGAGVTRGPSATHDAAAASHERETFRAIARSDREWDQILGPLRGWEPTFLWMVDGWAEVRVDVVTRSTLSGGPTERRVVVERRDGRTHGWEREPAGDEHEWLLAAPDRWVRRGGKPWTRTALEPTRTLAQLSASVPTLMQSLWEALPVAATEPLAGTRQVRCVRWRGAGHLVWEVDLGRRVVTRVRATDALGQHAWEETRAYEERAGRVLLTERRRRMADGREEVETSVWHTGPGSVSPAAVALPPQ